MLPSGGLDEHLVGGEVLGAAEGDAEAVGATGAEVEADFRRAGEEPPGPLRTVESITAELAETFAAWLGWWEGVHPVIERSHRFGPTLRPPTG